MRRQVSSSHYMHEYWRHDLGTGLEPGARLLVLRRQCDCLAVRQEPRRFGALKTPLKRVSNLMPSAQALKDVS